MTAEVAKEEKPVKRGPGRPKGSKNKVTSKKKTAKKKITKKKVTSKKVAKKKAAKKKTTNKKTTKKKTTKKKSTQRAAVAKKTVRKKGRPKKAAGKKKTTAKKKTGARRGPGRPPKNETLKISDAINRLVEAVEDLRDATRVYAEQEIAARQAVITRFQKTLKGAMGQVEEAAENTLKKFKG